MSGLIQSTEPATPQPENEPGMGAAYHPLISMNFADRTAIIKFRENPLDMKVLRVALPFGVIKMANIAIQTHELQQGR